MEGAPLGVVLEMRVFLKRCLPVPGTFLKFPHTDLSFPKCLRGALSRAAVASVMGGSSGWEGDEPVGPVTSSHWHRVTLSSARRLLKIWISGPWHFGGITPRLPQLPLSSMRATHVQVSPFLCLLDFKGTRELHPSKPSCASQPLPAAAAAGHRAHRASRQGQSHDHLSLLMFYNSNPLS